MGSFGRLSLLEDLPDPKALVLRKREVAHIVTMHKLLGALDERLEKVDGVILEGRQVCTALHGEEVKPEEKVME